jgi:hypothetical protein
MKDFTELVGKTIKRAYCDPYPTLPGTDGIMTTLDDPYSFTLELDDGTTVTITQTGEDWEQGSMAITITKGETK